MVVLQHGPAHGTESALRSEMEGLVGQVVEGKRPVVCEFLDFGPPHVPLVRLEFYGLERRQVVRKERGGRGRVEG